MSTTTREPKVVNYLSTTLFPYATTSIGEPNNSHLCFEVMALFLSKTLANLTAPSNFANIARII